MNKCTMWPVFILIGTVSGQQLHDYYAYLDGAVSGFDPLYMSGLQQPDPGRRSQIFEHLRERIYLTENQDFLNSFMGEAEATKCLPEIIVQKLVNYKDYQQFSASSSRKVSSDASCGSTSLQNENPLCDNENSRQSRAMLHFFKDIGGEVVLATAKCVTHTINIIPFEPTEFTQAFQTALVALNSAAIDPNSEIGNSTFAEFVKFFGTHFSQRTILGSKAIFGKLFATRATSIEEEKFRRQCVLGAAHEVLTPGERWSNETTLMHFSRAASERCREYEENDVIVTFVGPLPEGSLEDWALAAKESPQPIFHELEPVSTLFKQSWFDIVHQENKLNVNGTVLLPYFEKHLSQYSSGMVSGGVNCPPLKGCGINSRCQNGTECVNKPDTKLGYTCNIKEATTTTTARPTAPPPPPHTTCGGLLGAASDRSKSLTSHPGFGTSNYNDLVTLGYTLVAPAGYNVRIRFQAFNTESCCDHLYIFDGNTPSKTRIADLSGIPNLGTYTSTGTNMFLLFVTDHSVTSDGFSLRYLAVR